MNPHTIPRFYSPIDDPNPREYKGNWKHDKRDGKGKCRFCRGSTYKGDFKDDMIHGEGVFKFGNGHIYEGTFSDNKLHGNGNYIYPNGDRYEGTWHKDKMLVGAFYFSNGNLIQVNNVIDEDEHED